MLVSIWTIAFRLMKIPLDGFFAPYNTASPPGFKKLSTPRNSGYEIQIQIRIPQTESNQGIPIVTLYLFINLSLPEYIHQSTT